MSIVIDGIRDRDRIVNGRKTAILRYYPSKRPPQMQSGSEHNLHDEPGTAPFARVKIVDIQPIRLKDIKEGDALSLGFSGLGEFRHVWKNKHAGDKKMTDENQVFWIISFRVIDRM